MRDGSVRPDELRAYSEVLEDRVSPHCLVASCGIKRAEEAEGRSIYVAIYVALIFSFYVLATSSVLCEVEVGVVPVALLPDHPDFD